MGRASREKWIKRADAIEDLAQSQNQAASKAYFDRFSKKLHKLIKGARELAEEQAQDALLDPQDEPQG